MLFNGSGSYLKMYSFAHFLKRTFAHTYTHSRTQGVVEKQPFDEKGNETYILFHVFIQ